MKVGRKIHCLAVGMAAVAMFAIIGASPALAKPTSQTSAPCPGPKGIQGLQTDPNVGASFTNNGNVSSYKLSSNDQNAVNGVPGLIKYCVYPTGASHAPTVHVTAQGGQAENIQWTQTTSSKSPYNFSFQRPGGNATNIWFDENGETTSMGTANWGNDVPDSQKIILHVADPSLCNTDSGTCFVKPNPGPVCNAGDSSVAYNDMPFDVVNCLNPGVAFEANQWNEFGDSVTLQSGTGSTLNSLVVDFQSFACVTGTWDNQGGNNLCGGGTTPGVSPGTFTWPITANIYAADAGGLPTGNPLATTTVDKQIPFRPNADSTNCSSTPTKWFNPLAPGGGACQNSIAKKLTFDFSGQNVPADGKVVWTVAFNTSTSGYVPQGTQTPPCDLPAATATTTTCPQNPADSLNVGDKTYPLPAPYAGSSLFDTNGGLAVGSKGQPASALGFFTPDDNGRPLGEIVTGP